jgi:hypothetical protein
MAEHFAVAMASIFPSQKHQLIWSVPMRRLLLFAI